MSNKRQETIADIVREMRANNPEECYPAEYGGGVVPNQTRELANRIKAAHKREMEDEKRISDAVIQSLRDKKLEMAGEIAAKDAEIAELREENARLRAALKPVLECKVMSAMTAEIAPGRSKYCATIIEEAQHIYNEGETK